MKTQCINPDAIIAIARTIGHCDFRTTVSLYTTSTNSPWVITVGESTWQRHLIVESVSTGLGGLDATLAILASSESSKFGYNIHTDNIEKHIKLSELVGNGYVSVKKTLFPSRPKMANMTLTQLQSMLVGKRLRITDSKDLIFGIGDAGTCEEVSTTDDSNFAIHMDMDEAFMGQKKCAICFTIETVTPTSVEGPLLADKGGRRKIEVLG